MRLQRRSRSRVAMPAAVVALLLVAGWAPAALPLPTAPPSIEAAADAVPRTLVVVRNNNWLDMRIILTVDGQRYQLGTVTSFTRAVFKMPRGITLDSDQIRLLADPIGSRDAYASPLLLVNHGDVVEWRLENNLALSSLSVR